MFRLNALKSQGKTITLSLLMLGGGILHAQSAQEGLDALERQQYEKAKSVFKAIVQKNPTKGAGYYYLGNVYMENSKYDSASYYYEEGIKNDPKEALNYIGRGKIVLLHNASRAEADQVVKDDFQKAFELSKKKDPLVMQQIADALYEDFVATESDYARDMINKAMQMDKNNMYYVVTSGDVYRLAGEGGKGIEEYERASRTNPEFPLAPMKIGDFYNKVGNTDEAMKAYNMVLAIDPNYAPVYHALGEIYYKKGNINKAIESYQKFLSLVGKSPYEQVRYGSFLYLIGKYDESISELQKALAADPNQPVAYRLLGYSYLKKDDPDKANTYMKQFFDKMKDRQKDLIATDYSNYGDIQLKIGEDSLAIVNYRKAMAMDSTVDLYKNIADVYHSEKRDTKAADVMQEHTAYTAKMGKLDANDYYYMAKYYYSGKNYVQADSAFAKYNRLVPDQAAGALYRAMIHTTLDDPEAKTGAAQPYYDAFLEKVKGNENGDYKDFVVRAYNYAGVVAYNKKDNEKAEEMFKKAIAIDPNSAIAKQYLDYFEQLRKAKSSQKPGAKTGTKKK